MNITTLGDVQSLLEKFSSRIRNLENNVAAQQDQIDEHEEKISAQENIMKRHGINMNMDIVGHSEVQTITVDANRHGATLRVLYIMARECEGVTSCEFGTFFTSKYQHVQL